MKYLIILFLFIAVPLSAQVSELKGRVSNSADNSPLSQAIVILESNNIQVVSDESGSFLLKGNINEEDFIVVSHFGFESKKIKVKVFLQLPAQAILLENKIITSQTILVNGSIGQEGITPISFSKLKQTNIKRTYSVQDIPEVLGYQPSVTFYSENGNGIGYNYLSIRGFDQRRISVSINGVPQNDPEDNNVYWLDFPDILASTELIQVQRGAGSGIIGYPAVGGSINIITSTFSNEPKFELSSSLGSYDTRKYSAQFSSGLISNKYSFYVKLSQILSGGYRNSSWVDMKSYHVSAVRYDENLTSQVNLFGGPIADGLAYIGLPKFAITDKNLRKANYSYWEADDKEYTYTIERRPDEIENFMQPHFELLNEYRINNNIALNSALYLVLGKGFFDYDGSWSIYYDDYFRLKKNGYDSTKAPTNALIRAQVENKQWGWLPKLSIKHNNGELILGGELRFHRSVHWGSINYAENLPEGVTNEYRYYYYEGGKDILSFYGHENYQLNNEINILAEGQLAYHKYKLFNEMYVGNDFEVTNLFFNPRLGINYKINPSWNTYFSFARVSREPRLKNYYDAAESSDSAIPQFELDSKGNYDFTKPLVKPENMNNIEIGTSYSRGDISLSGNVFYMLFNNEIISKGQVDRFGQPITGNMERTIHYGLETSVDLKLDNTLEFLVNGSFSKNYISSGKTFVATKNLTGNEVVAVLDLANNSISGFPKTSLNALLKFTSGNFFAQVSAKYVGEFYTDNYAEQLSNLLKKYPSLTSYKDNLVDSYFVANIFASYDLSSSKYYSGLKIFFQINNLFDNLYAAYGIGGEFFPAAERNFIFGINLGL
jgi:iron complex outermembrane recepter protein